MRLKIGLQSGFDVQTSHTTAPYDSIFLHCNWLAYEVARRYIELSETGENAKRSKILLNQT